MQEFVRKPVPCSPTFRVWWRYQTVLCLSILLWSLHISHGHSMAETYYVVPTAEQLACPEPNVPCMTLAEYAKKPSNYFTPNTTLILLPGNHALDQNLILTGLTHVEVVTMTDNMIDTNTSLNLATHVTVICSKSASLNFVRTNIVHVKGLSTFGCAENRFLSIERFTLEDSSIVGQGDISGCGVIMSNVSEAIITETTFSANGGMLTPDNDTIGGAIVSFNSKLVISKTIFNDNYVVGVVPDAFSSGTADGGAVRAFQSTMYIDSSTFSNNTSTHKGGGVHTLNSTVAFRNCTMSYNKAEQGGAIYADPFSILTIDGSVFSNNEAHFGGVILSATEYHVEINSSVFLNNTAVDTAGVLYVLSSNNTLKVNNCYFEGNKAVSAGVIIAFDITLVIHNSHFQHNKAEVLGGVISTQDGSLVNFHSCSFSNNTASYGGVIAADRYSTVAIVDGSFQYNTAIHGGGVISASHNTVISIDDGLFKYNSAAQGGGMLLLSNSSHVTVSSSHFQHNRAVNGHGGVIYAQHNSTILINAQSTFNENKAGPIHSGGALFAETFSTITINSAIFEKNLAVSGGSITAMNGTFLSIDNSKFQHNQAGTGGAIYALNGTTVTINNSHFQNNSVRASQLIPEYYRWVNGSGGVLCAEVNTNVIIHSSTFFDNNAITFGGVVLVNTGLSIMVYNATFERNSALSGGCIAIEYWTRVTINQSNFLHNRAEVFSGVLFAARNVSVSIISSTHYNNSAGAAGVVAAMEYTMVQITDCYFQFNRAENYNGGVIVQVKSNVTINRSTFHHNKADNGTSGVLYTSVSSTVNVYHSTFQWNTAHSAGVIGTKSSSLLIYNCSFQYNEGIQMAGVIAASYSDIVIVSSTFYQNTAATTAGVLLVEGDNSTIIVQNTNMDSNSADMVGGIILCTGSISHAPREIVTAIGFENVTLSRNAANGFGSVMYLHQCNLSSSGFLNIHENVDVTSLGVAYLIQSTANFLGKTNISDNLGSIIAIESTITFSGETDISNGNSALKGNNYVINDINFPEGGAITLFNSALFLFGKTTLVRNLAYNGGAILAMDSIVQMSGVTEVTNNVALLSGGAVYAYQSDINFIGINTFANNSAVNSAGAIHAIGSTIKFVNGTHHFVYNVAKSNGGALFLELNSKVHIAKIVKEDQNCSEDRIFSTPCIQNSALWLKVEFANNSADFGGAIFVEDSTNSDSCLSVSTLDSSSPTNECFFQTLQEYFSVAKPPDFPIRNTFFSNNTAIKAGDDLYGGLLDRCTLNPLVERFGNIQDYTALHYIQNVTNVRLDSISSLPLRVCFCDHDGKPNCSYQPPPVNIKKGQSFTVSAVIVDQVYHTLPSGTIHCSTSSQNGGLAEGQTRQNTRSENCTEFTYTLLSPSLSDKLICYAEGPCNDLGISKQLLEVHFSPCPTGFTLSFSNSSCDCDPALQPYVTNCSISTGSLLRQGEFWISHVDSELNTSEESGYVIYSHCPFDYCYPPTEPVYFYLTNNSGVDRQCAFNRSGKLCGHCKSGLSLSLGSTHCETCSSYWLLLLVPFALAGIVLVALILMLNLTVAVGTINGIVFYASIVAVNRDVYFTFEKTNFLTVFISWINLDFGFETCFYNGLDAYVKTWLQFLFPLYIIFLVVAIIVISDYSPQFASLFTGKNPVATLATLILLSYTKLLRTIISALSFAQINYPDGSQEIVWLHDANVPYLRGKHIPLFIAAVITAFVGLAYTLVLFSWQLLLRCPRRLILLRWMTNSKLLAFIDAYHAPYNQQHRYWTGLLLLLRAMLYLISAVNVLGDPRVNLVSVICTMAFLFVHTALVEKPLKKFLLNLVEFVHLFNLTIFTTLTFYFIDSHGNQTALAFTSSTIAVALFGVIVIYHMTTFTLKRRKEKIKHVLRFIQHFKPTRLSLRSDQTELPNVVADLENGSGVTVTEIDEPSKSEDDSDDEECSTLSLSDRESTSDSSSDCDETMPLLDSYST